MSRPTMGQARKIASREVASARVAIVEFLPTRADELIRFNDSICEFLTSFSADDLYAVLSDASVGSLNGLGDKTLHDVLAWAEGQIRGEV